MKTKKKSDVLVILLIIFIIIDLSLASYIVYDSYSSKKEVKITNNKKDDTKSIQGYYVGSKGEPLFYCCADFENYKEWFLANVQMGLFDNNNAILYVDLMDPDICVYKGSYSITSDGNITFSLNKKITYSGELKDINPIEVIYVKKNDISFIYNLENYKEPQINKDEDEQIPKEDVYLNKTSDKAVKNNLDNLYSKFENN